MTPKAILATAIAVMVMVAVVLSFALLSAGNKASHATTPPLKPPIAGLLDRGGAPSSAFYSVIDGYVLNVNWSALQATQGAQLTANNPIDAAIAKVRNLNASGAHLALKLRVFAGIDAPTWAKTLGGAPIPVSDPNSGASGTIGRYWTVAYEAAYADLEAKLAAKYDGVPEIRETTVSGCMTIYAEPFIIQISNPKVVRALWNAGYTLSAAQGCMTAAIRSHMAWATTRSDLSFNPYQEILSATSTKTDEAFTAAMILYCRATLGASCILENNSLRSTSQSKDYDAMYASIKAAGPNITFQTATLARVGNLLTTLGIAVGLGAGSVELPSGYQSSAAGIYAATRAQLIANSRP